MKYLQRDFDEYFKKIQNTKITNTIINDASNAKKVLLASVLWVLLTVLGSIFYSINKNKTMASVLWIIVIVLIIYTVAKVIKMDNKDFNIYPILNREFYLLFLTKEYAIKHIDEKTYLDRMYSIQTKLLQVLSENLNTMRAVNAFEITKSEKLMTQISNDFNNKLRVLLCNKEQIGDIIEIIDILLSVLLSRICKDSDDNISIEKKNDDIEELLKRYEQIVKKIPITEPKYTLASKVKNVQIKIKALNTPACWVVSTIIVLGIYAVSNYYVNRKIEPAYIITITISMIALAKSFIK